MAEDQKIFISSSLDLKQQRADLDGKLQSWLRRRGKLDAISPYLWEKETEEGKLLSYRVEFQLELQDVLDERVVLTICMFGERCGLPLQEDLHGVESRFAPWRSDGTMPGILHPWPTTLEAQEKALDAGAFPLTGTIFELFSALAQKSEPDAATGHLIVGYVANRDVEIHTKRNEIVFNRRQLEERLAPRGIPDVTRNQILEEYYYPQIRGLINLLKFLKRRVNAAVCYSSAEEMVDDIYVRAVRKLSDIPGFSIDRNPFNASLGHWGIDDERPLPGRSGYLKDLLGKLRDSENRDASRFMLLRGRSGCGKSSILHAGLLKQLQNQGSEVAAFRPADLIDANTESSALDALWAFLCDKVDGCWSAEVARAPASRKAAVMASRLISRLDALDQHFVLGLDQFEEMLDDLKLFADDKDKPHGWWQVLHFLRHAIASPRFTLIGTLESQRGNTFKALKIEEFLGVEAETSDVPDGADFIERAADEGFSSTGLLLDAKLIRKIKEAWLDFENKQPESSKTSSPLPLVALWLHRLYVRFEYLANPDAAVSVTNVMNRAASKIAHVIKWEDIKDEGVAFGSIIAELADEAWDAANAERITQGPETGQPNPLSFSNFLSSFVDFEDGQIQLPAAPREISIPNVDAIIASFQAHRLLVPAGTDGSMLRIVHQSLLEQWPPAKAWYGKRISYLQIENDLQLLAKRWKARGCSQEFLSSQTNRELVRQAAQVLNENRVVWPNRAKLTLTKEEEGLCDFSMAVFSRATDPMEMVPDTETEKRFVHIAAVYGMIDLLEKFWTIDQKCLQVPTTEGATALHQAAWFDTGAIEYLIGKGADPDVEMREVKYLAISHAIYAGAVANYNCLIAANQNKINAPIDHYQNTMLCMAANGGQSWIAQDLLRRGADPKGKNAASGFPLGIAASNGHEGVFRLLLPFGGIDEVDNFQDTAIHCAARLGHTSVLNAFLRADLDEETVIKVMSMRNNRAMSPLMEAAYEKRPEALQALLSGWTDAAETPHVHENGDTLLHLALTVPTRSIGYNKTPQKDELVRARKVVEVLLADGRFDPNAKNANGMTPFDIGETYDDARKVLRRDERIPQDYSSLTPQMRADDLLNRKGHVALNLIRSAPQVLTDMHTSKQGIDIFLENGNLEIVSEALEQGLIPSALIESHSEKLLDLLGKKHTRLRTVLLKTLEEHSGSTKYLPILMDVALSESDPALVDHLRALGCDQIQGRGIIKRTIFHHLAIAGNLDRFKELAAGSNLRMPFDNWGRRPSDTAPNAARAAFSHVENECFAAADPIVVPTPQELSFFHHLASNGNVERFEKLARLAEVRVPRDKQGRRPSDLANEQDRPRFVEIEELYFQKEN